MKNKVLILCILILSSTYAHAGIKEYQDFNDLLFQVHKAYSKKDFSSLDKLREDYIKTYENFNPKDVPMKSSKTGDFKKNLDLAKSYYLSLKNYYEPLKLKYGQGTVAPLRAASENTDSLTPSRFSVPQKTPELLFPTEKAESNLSEDNIDLNQFAANLKDETEIWDDADDSSLDKEIPDPSNDPDWDFLPKATEVSEASKKSDPKFNEKLNKFLEKLKSKRESKPQFLANQKRVNEIYLFEKSLIDEGLKKIKIINENQARFEMKVVRESVLPLKVKEKRNPPSIFSADRLLENDDDIILLKVRE